MSRAAYEWKIPSLYKGVDAQRIGEHLEQLRKAGTKLTPKTIVQDAVSPRSPLHRCFEWNDSKAAAAYRLTQARYLVDNLTVRVKVRRRKEPAKVRAFVSVHRKGDGQEYVGVRTALRDPQMRSQVLSKAMREVEQWRNRYSDLKELCSIFSAIDVATGDLQLQVK